MQVKSVAGSAPSVLARLSAEADVVAARVCHCQEHWANVLNKRMLQFCLSAVGGRGLCSRTKRPDVCKAM
jgi:hypothetical protein